jgi:hypothetical protein
MGGVPRFGMLGKIIYGSEKVKMPNAVTRSMRKADTPYEVFKARVRTERIQAWPEQDAGVKPLFVAFFEPTHGLIPIPERCIDYGNLRSIRMARV